MRSIEQLTAVLALVLVGLVAADAAYGQYESGQWRAMPTLGVYTYDDATPLETTGFVGGEAHFSLNPSVSLGIAVSFARPEVDGSYFPLVLFKVAADTSLLFQAGQQATQVTYGALLSLGAPLGRLYVYGQGGLGGYTYFMDDQVVRDLVQSGGKRSTTGVMIPVGAGVSYSVSSLVGIRIEVRDEILTDFDREDFNPVEPQFQNTCEVENFCILEANGTPPEPSSTVHNFRFNIGFEFTPGR